MSEVRLWTLATAASICLHGVAAAGLILLPAPERERRGETVVDIHDVPGSLTQKTATARPTEPAELEKKLAVAVHDSTVSEPAQSANRKALDAAATSAEVEAVTSDRALAATAAGSRAAVAASQERPSVSSVARTRSDAPIKEREQIIAAAALQAADTLVMEGKAGSAALAPSARLQESAAVSTTAQALAAAEMPRTTISAQPRAGVPATARPDPVSASLGSEADIVPAAPGAGAQIASIPAASTPALAPSGERAAAASAPEGVRIAAAPVQGPAIGVSPVPREAPRPSASDDTGLAVLTPPRVPPRPIPPAQEIAPYAKMVDYLSLHEGTCLLALASAGQDRRLGIDGFSGSQEEITRLRKELARMVGVPVETRAHPVSRDQCGALSFARRLLGYPVPALDVRPDVHSIESGGDLSGRIENIRRKMVYLLLVDDDGKVEEIQDLFMDGGAVGFSAPMTLEDGPVETVQILMALASDERLETVSSHDGMHADAYFAALADELARTGNAVDFGMTFFSVR
jgi:hypothetical protein